MKAIVTTTITTVLDIETMTVKSHNVDVGCDDDLPESIVLALVEGGMLACVKETRKRRGVAAEEVDLDED